MMAYALHLLANIVHQVRLLMHMLSAVDLMGNAVHPSVLPDVHDGICSTLSEALESDVHDVCCRLGRKVHDGICCTPTGKYSTPSEAPDAHDGYCRLGRKCGVHPSVLPDVHDGICSTPTGK